MTTRDSNAPTQRQLRVGEELRHALSAILMHGDLRDPALHDVSVTVSEVRVGPDLRNATAFVLPLGGGDAVEILAALKRATPYLRGRLGRAVRLKFTPNLTFRADRSFDYAQKIDTLLHSPPVARDLGGDDGGVDGDGA
ncbi:MAG: 30S ribosome-binding factor RbfA [Alphaproteobacteria bacterium]